MGEKGEEGVKSRKKMGDVIYGRPQIYSQLFSGINIPWIHNIINILNLIFFQELAKLLENQHGYIDLHNIPENKYYSMTQTSDEDEKL